MVILHEYRIISHFVRSKQYSICLLQETHSGEGTQKNGENEFF